MKAFPRMALPWLLLTLLVSGFWGAGYCGEDKDNIDGFLNTGARGGADARSESAPMGCLGQGVPVNFIIAQAQSEAALMREKVQK